MKDKLNIISRMLWLVFCLFFKTDVQGQGQANYWTFSNNALLKFDGIKNPTISQSNFYTSFGSASASDCNGKLLFYSNGSVVYDSTGSVVNSNPLINSSDKNDCIIIPHPANPFIYYLFYFRNISTNLALSYCTIDYSSGAPVVVDTSSNLLSNCSNKIAGIAHANGTDFWVVIHEYNSDRFLSYLINSNGLNFNPVVSSVGSVHTGAYARDGQMRFSPKGNKLGVCVNASNIVDVFDFDKQTGVLSNSINFSSLNITHPYGFAFSQDESNFYITTDSLPRLYQVRENKNTFPVSYEIYLLDSLFSGNFGQLQNAPDGSIYVAVSVSSFIGKIDFPNSIGSTCGYARNALFLQGSQCFKGLPNFVQSYFDKTFEFSGNNVCFNDSSNFKIPVIPFLTLPSSLFTGDGSVINTTLYNSYDYKYNAPGTYISKLVVYYACSNDTLTDTIIVKDIPEFNLGNDTSICSNETITLTAPISNANYLWSTGDDVETIVTLPANEYTLSINKEGCFYQDNIYIHELLNPVPTVSGDLVACKNLEINATAFASEAAVYDWGNLNSNTKWVTITNPGLYNLEVTYLNGCKNKLDFEIKESCPFVYFAPNTFTPDADGLNDNFCIQISGYTSYQCLVYNRNGQLVFSSDSPDNCWNGNGCLQGVYRYSIRIIDVNGRSHQKNGIIQLLK